MKRLNQPDVLLALFVTGIVSMLLIPFPPAVLDVLLATNIACSVLILVVTLFAKSALSVSTFPTILLITTLFRLGLNVSTTRLILTKGDAGEVVRAFGEFVVQGDLIVGLVVFLLLTMVQLLVVGKGAERVAEVAARFTLDAMPGKQLSVDAALRAGALTEAEAQQRRDDLSRESQLFGAMDGAMKFVKGDAIAGLVIVALNLVAGFVMGVARQGLSFGDAIEIYSVLSIGDALVAQVPALLITLSAGVLTTRVAPKDTKHDLGQSLQNELFASNKVVGIGGGLAIALALVPGLPALPFLIIGSTLSGLVIRRVRNEKRASRQKAGDHAKRDAFQAKMAEQMKRIKAQRAIADSVAPAAHPLQLLIGSDLSSELGLGTSNESELIGALSQMRDVLFGEIGVRFPGAQVLPSAQLPARAFQVKIYEVPMMTMTIPSNVVNVLDPPARLMRLGIEAQPAPDPWGGQAASWVKAAEHSVVSAAGSACFKPAFFIAGQAALLLKKNARRFVGLHEVNELIDRLEKGYPALVKEVVPKLVSLSQLADILRRLVEENVSIRDLKTILEGLAEHAPFEQDALALTERVRASLGDQLAHRFAEANLRLSVLLLDPLIEDVVRSAIVCSRGVYTLALEPELKRSIVDATQRTLRSLAPGIKPIILAHADIRRFMRLVLQQDVPEVNVLGYDEIPPRFDVRPIGRVVVREALAA